MRINTSELPNVALLRDGGLLVATSTGLRLSRDQGCSWSDVGQMESISTPAPAADPNDRDSVVVASYDGDVPGLRSTRDAGASWTLLYPTEVGDYVHSLLVAAADSVTLYATVTSYAPGVAPVHSRLRTRDGGESWQRCELPLTERDYLARAVGVSPRDPALLVLYTVPSSRHRRACTRSRVVPRAALRAPASARALNLGLMRRSSLSATSRATGDTLLSCDAPSSSLNPRARASHERAGRLAPVDAPAHDRSLYELAPLVRLRRGLRRLAQQRAARGRSACGWLQRQQHVAHARPSSLAISRTSSS